MKIKNMMCALLAVVLTQTGFAFYNSSSTCFEVDAEFLYWSPLFSDEAFAVEIDSGRDAKEFLTNDRYKPAFRVAARPLRNACWDLELRFTYFNGGTSGYSRSVPDNGADFVFLPNDLAGIQTAIEGQNHTKYYGFDLADHRCLYNDSAWHLSALWGMHSAWLWHRLDSQALLILNGAVVNSQTTASTWAIGPQFGVGIEHPLWRCFSLYAEGRGSLLVAQKHFNSKLISSVAPTRSWNTTTQWQLFPAIDAKLGANYAFGYGCLKGKIELGYEFLSYSNALFWDGSNSNRELTSSKSLGFHGPYAGFQVLF